MRRIISALIGLLAIGAVAQGHSTHVAAPAQTTAKAILAGGCFWCLEHDMRQLPGVVAAVSGYSGGTLPDPTYRNHHVVTAEQPEPHYEVVEVTYDTTKLTYEKVLDYYVRHIDPTDGGGQFCDRGTPYSPVIFTASEAETAVAKAKLAEASRLLNITLAVKISPAKTFWPAEEYHQDYANKNPLRYAYYRASCGRDRRVNAVWSAAAASN